MKNPMMQLLLDLFHFLFGGERCGVQDRIGMKIAARHGKIQEYKKARRQNMRVLEVLEEWDLVTEKDRELFRD